MNKQLLTFSFLFLFFSAFAQFNTPSVDGTIGAGEYGMQTEDNNQKSSDGRTWFVTWDDANLYVAVSGYTNPDDAVNLYIDIDAETPVNGGTNASGALIGPNFDNVVPDLPFRGDFFAFVKNSFDNNKTDDGSGGWNAGTDNTLPKSYNDGNDVLEFSIPWSNITGAGRPAAFNWIGYHSFSGGGGGTFARVPTENPSGTSPDMQRYYTVSDTNDGSATKPFAQNSYTHIGTSNNSFGAITVYDFTMNTGGQQISRGNTAGNWVINNDLVVNDGSVFFGSGAGSYGTTFVGGDVIVSGGLLSMDQTNQAMDVAGSVTVSTGATLSLSTSIGGDIDIAGNFTNNGTFNGNERAVTMNGSFVQQQIDGVATTIDFLIVDNTMGLLINNALTIDNEITLTNGRVNLGTENLVLGANATVGGTPSASNMILADGNTGAFLRKMFSGDGSFTFPIGTNIGSDIDYTPVTVSNVTGTNYAGGYIEARVLGVQHPDLLNDNPDDFIERYWFVEQAGFDVTSYDISCTYTDNDVNGDESNILFGKRSNNEWEIVGTADAATNTLNATGLMSFSEFTGAQQNALPVELVHFSGENSGKYNKLTWQTAAEYNHDFFTVQRSADGRNFTDVAKVREGVGENGFKNYSYNDAATSSADTYYRLQQVDLDGTAAYSDIILLKNRNTGILSLYPNPVITQLSVDLAGYVADEIQISVTDSQGKIMPVAAFGPTTEMTTFDVTTLPTGVYFVLIQDANGEMLAYQKFIKK